MGVSVELAFKQRMVGAIFILSLGVILIPVLFDSPQVETKVIAQKPDAPAMPDVAAVNEISYVFSDLESNFKHADSQPEPVTEPLTVNVAQLDDEPSVVEPDTHVTIEPQDNDSAPQEQVKPVAPKPVAPAPAIIRTKVASTAVGDWTIQLGAFSSRQNASILLNKLTQQGFNRI